MKFVPVRRINLSRIKPEKRAEAWDRLKREYPAQAAWVEDPFVQHFKQAFDCELIIDLPVKESPQ